MGLRDLSFPTVTVQTSGGPLVVRGLSLDNALGLFNRHRDEVTTGFDTIITKARGGETASPEDMAIVILSLIDAAPVVAAEIITLAAGIRADDDDFAEQAFRVRDSLNVAEQIDALEKIAGQTFSSDMPPGKMFALLLKLTQVGSSAKAA